MKTRFILNGVVLGVLLLAPAALGQANFWFINSGKPVFDAYGARLVGADFLAELYGGMTPDLLAPTGLFPRGERQITSFDTQYPGLVIGVTVVVLDVPPNGWAWLQMRAWEARLGATYEEVVARGLGGYGESQVFYAKGGNPYDFNGAPGLLIGLQSFRLRLVIPEPSTWALLALGGAGVAWATRRHRRR
jgi:hypothetical protein